MIQSSELAMICTVCTLGMVAIAPKVGRFSRQCWRRRLSGLGEADMSEFSLSTFPTRRLLRDRQAGTRPPKNGDQGLAQRVRLFDVKIISAPA